MFQHTAKFTFFTLAVGITLACASDAVLAHDHAHMQAMQNMDEPASVPSDSLQQLRAPLFDQHGVKFTLADEHRDATLLTMFYGDCQIACPIIIENVKRTLEALPPALQARTRVVLISLNPGVDTPASLSKLASMHGLPEQNFRFAVSDNDAHTRELAAALGIKYRKTANGEINHSTRILLADRNGRVVTSSDKLDVQPDEALLAALRKQLTGAPAAAPM